MDHLCYYLLIYSLSLLFYAIVVSGSILYTRHICQKRINAFGELHRIEEITFPPLDDDFIWKRILYAIIPGFNILCALWHVKCGWSSIRYIKSQFPMKRKRHV